MIKKLLEHLDDSLVYVEGRKYKTNKFFLGPRIKKYDFIGDDVVGWLIMNPLNVDWIIANRVVICDKIVKLEKGDDYRDQISRILLDVDPDWYHKFKSPSDAVTDYYHDLKNPKSKSTIIWNCIRRFITKIPHFCKFW